MTSPSFGEIMYSAIVVNIANFVLAIGLVMWPIHSTLPARSMWLRDAAKGGERRSTIRIFGMQYDTVLLKLPLWNKVYTDPIYYSAWQSSIPRGGIYVVVRRVVRCCGVDDSRVGPSSSSSVDFGTARGRSQQVLPHFHQLFPYEYGVSVGNDTWIQSEQIHHQRVYGWYCYNNFDLDLRGWRWGDMITRTALVLILYIHRC